MNNKSIRLTSTSYAVLGLLELFGPATPYALKQSLERSIQNFWPVPHTTFYDEPARLATGGYLSVSQETGGRRRKVYALTDTGREALQEWAHAPVLTPPQLRDEGLLKIFVGADPRAVFERQREWYQAKLTELEGYLENLQAARGGPREDRWRGVETTLLAGIAYHHQLLEPLNRVVAEGDEGSHHEEPHRREESRSHV